MASPEGLEDVELNLAALRHGCGLNLSLSEIGELEWPDAKRKSDWLIDFLGRCLPQQEKKDGAP